MKLLKHPTIGLTSNLYSCVAQNIKNEIKILFRDPDNDRNFRARPEDCQRAIPLKLPKEMNERNDRWDKLLAWHPLLAQKSNFAEKSGAFGYTWAYKYKDDGSALPSVNEIMEGIIAWDVRITEMRMKGKSTAEFKKVIRRSRTTYQNLFNSI